MEKRILFEVKMDIDGRKKKVNTDEVMNFGTIKL